MDSPQPEKKRLQQWWVFLSQLRLTVHHIQGLGNELSNELGRNSFDDRLGQSSEELARDALAKIDVQLDLFMKTTQPQRKWGKGDLSKYYAETMKQLQLRQVQMIAGEQWAMMKDALYKGDQVYVPESHLEETLPWCHTGCTKIPVVLRPPLQLQTKLMTAVTKDCHCMLGKPNSKVVREEVGNLIWLTLLCTSTSCTCCTTRVRTSRCWSLAGSPDSYGCSL